MENAVANMASEAARNCTPLSSESGEVAAQPVDDRIVPTQNEHRKAEPTASEARTFQ